MLNNVVMRTTVAPKYVHYMVVRKDESVAWETYVPFGCYLFAQRRAAGEKGR